VTLFTHTHLTISGIIRYTNFTLMALRKIVLGLVIAFSFVATTMVSAAPPLLNGTLNTPGTTKTLLLPPAASNASVITLGSAIDPATSKKVDGLAIIHRRDSGARSGGGKPGSTTCATYLAKGAKWKTVEPWIANLENTFGLDQTALFNLVDGGLVKWEDAADGVVGDLNGIEITGTGTATAAALEADMDSPDAKNEVYFADVSDSNAIAVTIVWGVFGGPLSGRELVEWDQVYDPVDFSWSASEVGVPGKMDFNNIATHELGHTVGMGDLYNTCVAETMYGYAVEAETSKRDLNAGDITGINTLY
jgi:hypothetical protein